MHGYEVRDSGSPKAQKEFSLYFQSRLSEGPLCKGISGEERDCRLKE